MLFISVEFEIAESFYEKKGCFWSLCRCGMTEKWKIFGGFVEKYTVMQPVMPWKRCKVNIIRCK